MSLSSIRRNIGVFTNVLVILLVAFALLRPSGPVGADVVTWYQGVQARRIVAKEWPTIAAARRLDTAKTPVTLVEFSDYECPFCRKQWAVLQPFLVGSNARGLAFRHLPLQGHAHAEGAARTAICAEAQGKFREMSNRLFATDTWLADTNWMREAVAVSVPDTAAFRRCRTSPETTARLKADMALADTLNIHGTPTWVTPVKIHQGGLPDSMYLTFGLSSASK